MDIFAGTIIKMNGRRWFVTGFTHKVIGGDFVTTVKMFEMGAPEANYRYMGGEELATALTFGSAEIDEAGQD